MCIIMIYEDDFPKLEDLKSAEKLNSHGGGYAYRKGNKIHFKKSENLTSEDIMNDIEELKIKLPIIIHFRIKSSGILSDQLCHPFPITKSLKKLNSVKGISDKVLFHNGTYSDYKDDLFSTCKNQSLKIPSEDLSDSKAISYLCAIYGNNYLRVIDSSSRYVIFSKNKIEKFGQWSTVDNVHLSNENHIKPKFSSWNNYSLNYSNSWDAKKIIQEIPKEIEKPIVRKKTYDLIKTDISDFTEKQLEDLANIIQYENEKITQRINQLEDNLIKIENDKKYDKTQTRIIKLQTEQNNLKCKLEEIYDNSNIVDEISLYNYGF